MERGTWSGGGEREGGGGEGKRTWPEPVSTHTALEWRSAVALGG
jgi:hypothetical protein